MTDERKNEIWEYLPNDIRCKLQRDYIKACEAQEFDPHNDRINVHRMFMQKYFGKDNMEELKELNDYNLSAQAENDKTSENNLLDIANSKSNLQQNVVSSVDYAAYRLDLAKELALKVANNRALNVAKFAVDTANEIVKRLKETEE